MSNGGDSGDAIGAVLLGILGGAIGAYIVKKLLENMPVPCPKCKKPIQEGVKRCPHCGAYVEWV